MTSFVLGVIASLFGMVVALMASGALRLFAVSLASGARAMLACRIVGIPAAEWKLYVRAAVLREAMAQAGDPRDLEAMYFATRELYKAFGEEFMQSIAMIPWERVPLDGVARWSRIAARVVRAADVHGASNEQG